MLPLRYRTPFETSMLTFTVTYMDVDFTVSFELLNEHTVGLLAETVNPILKQISDSILEELN